MMTAATTLLLLQRLFRISMWLALSFVLHTLFLSFITTLPDINDNPSFPEEEMKCQEVKSGVQAQRAPTITPAAFLQ